MDKEYKNRLKKAHKEYRARQAGISDPKGCINEHDRYVISDEERRECCNYIIQRPLVNKTCHRKHVKSSTHVAALFNVKKYDLEAFHREWKRNRGKAASSNKPVASFSALDKQIIIEENTLVAKAAKEYIDRRDRRSHPQGSFQSMTNRKFTLDAIERCDCCAGIRTPSSRFPYTEMKHARTLKHVANLFNVDPKLMRKKVKELTVIEI